MILTPNVSKRITLLRFPLITAVVCMHGYLLDEVQVGGVSRFIQSYLSHSLARIAVPLFFLISGYLLFQGYEPRLEVYKKKLSSRVRTLVIPFIIWNVAKLLFLAIIQSVPAFSSYVSSADLQVAEYEIIDYFVNIFGIGRQPVAYQFWFIRDLMVVVVLSPVLLFLLRSLPRVSFLFFFVVWLGNFKFLQVDDATMFFFFAGAWLSTSSLSLDFIDRKGKLFIGLLFLFTVLNVLAKGCWFNLYVDRISIIAGLCGVWAIAGYLCENVQASAICSRLSFYAFFVFAAHQPTLKIIQKLGFGMFSIDNDLKITLLYIVAPIITIGLTLFGGVVIKRVVPKTYRVITGGR